MGRCIFTLFNTSFHVTNTKEWLRTVGRISFSCCCHPERPHQHPGKARAEMYHPPPRPRASSVLCSNALLGNVIRIRQKHLQKHICVSDRWLLGNDSFRDNYDRQLFNKNWHFSWTSLYWWSTTMFYLKVSGFSAKPVLMVDSPNHCTLTKQLWTIHTHGKHCLMYHQNLINVIRLASP